MTQVERVRVSLGTAMQFGLLDGDPGAHYTTAFLMTYRSGRCAANCAFCPQARESHSSSDRLSRIAWPDFEFARVLDATAQRGHLFERLCIQCILYPGLVDDIERMVLSLRNVTQMPISVASGPLSEEELSRLRSAGVNDIGIAMDASTPEIFDRVKGSGRRTRFRWDSHVEAIRRALRVFGRGHVTTHLIVGLGETEAEALDFLKMMHSLGVTVGLFALTSVRGTAMEDALPPPLSVYRRIQAARYLLFEAGLNQSLIRVDEEGRITVKLDSKSIRGRLSTGIAFMTSGCKGCNRPYYNERPRGPMYNFHRPLTREEAKQALHDTELI